MAAAPGHLDDQYARGEKIAALDSFSTPRLLAERVTAAHWLDLRRMDEDESFMARLGGVRDAAGTVAYLEANVKHWADHGFGMWMLRDSATSAVVGRAILRHLEVDGVNEVAGDRRRMSEKRHALALERCAQRSIGQQPVNSKKTIRHCERSQAIQCSEW